MAKAEFSPADMANARECFRRAQDLVGKKNYDYAIELYISGLNHWPEAVDEGHNPCRAAALFRGGKKVGFADGMKYKTSGKDAKKAMLNAEMLLSKDPRNIGYMEAMFKNAARAGFDLTTMWIGDILSEAVIHESKPNPARFELLRDIYEQLGDRNQEADLPLAIKAMEKAVEAMSRLRSIKPTDGELATELRDLAGKLTILKGRYSSAESFKDSVEDTEGQRELHDRDRLVQTDDRMGDLIAKARQRYEADPTDPTKVNTLVELLCRREQAEEEKQAIGILVQGFKTTGEYRFKMRADDIYMKQLKRKARQLRDQGQTDLLREHLEKQLKFELSVFKERVKQYPTDLRLRYQYGVRLFQAGRYDDAIPALQEARNDPKVRFHCNLHIGRCFFEKGFHGQAADIFREAIASYEIPDDDIGKELHYWMGRSMEAEGSLPDALKIYGQIIQWDYNYRKGDVRKRIERIKSGQSDAGDA